MRTTVQTIAACFLSLATLCICVKHPPPPDPPNSGQVVVTVQQTAERHAETEQTVPAMTPQRLSKLTKLLTDLGLAMEENFKVAEWEDLTRSPICFWKVEHGLLSELHNKNQLYFRKAINQPLPTEPNQRIPRSHVLCEAKEDLYAERENKDRQAVRAGLGKLYCGEGRPNDFSQNLIERLTAVDSTFQRKWGDDQILYEEFMEKFIYKVDLHNAQVLIQRDLKSYVVLDAKKILTALLNDSGMKWEEKPWTIQAVDNKNFGEARAQTFTIFQAKEHRRWWSRREKQWSIICSKCAESEAYHSAVVAAVNYAHFFPVTLQIHLIEPSLLKRGKAFIGRIISRLKKATPAATPAATPITLRLRQSSLDESEA